MQVLVTGASGFVGSHLVRMLAARGFRAIGLHRRDPGLGADLDGLPNSRLLRADIASLEALPAGTEAVVHAAATSAWTGISDDSMVHDNVIGTRHLLTLAERHGCAAFVYLSSMSVYGRIETSEVSESTPIVDPDVYGLTKLLGERMLEDRQARLPGLVLRLPGVVGRGARRNWLASTAARLSRGEPATLFNADAAFNNAVHVADIAALIARNLERGWAGCDRMVLGARGSLTIRAVVERLAAGMGVVPRLDIRPATKPAFTLSSAHAIDRWGYDPLEIGALIDRFATESRPGVA